ncbi:DWNN domain-containing protein [Phyllosticta capitalensis]|uniref:DWNN domain-containing protein n=1 Tax=Phyllosticta capitalensis TaxID=121624 RepID=A0ABR1YEE4_9PEZI
MSSSVFFKFKSSKEPQRITFDGTGISVFELKREIINATGLGDGTDFDLSIYADDTNEGLSLVHQKRKNTNCSLEYDDDTTIVPRSTTVLVRRLPAARPGHGRAARYVSGKAPVTAKNSYRTEASSKPAVQAKSFTDGAAAMNNAQTEEERIAAMFAAGAENWEQQKARMADAKPVYRPGNRGRPHNVPEGEPPETYICHRCHVKGHWIQACPTNDDPNFENKPRIKRTTGIPRSMLQTIEKPVALANDGLTDETRQPSGVMVNAAGEYVIAKPDEAAWNKYQAKAQASAAQQLENASAGSKELQDRGLECSVDKRMFVEPMKTPCCGMTYCNDCIENALINSDFVCPNCSKEDVFIDNLVPDEEVAAKIKAYEDEKAAERKAKEASKSPKSEKAIPVNGSKDDKAASTNGSPENKAARPASVASQSPAVTPSTASATPATTNGASKKRPAEEELKNDRIPTAPAAMRKQQEQQKLQAPSNPDEAFMNPMNAVAGMPPFNMGNQFPNGNMMGFGGMPGMGFPNQNMMGMGMSIPGSMGMPNAMMNPMMMQQNGGWGNMGGMGYPPNGMYGNMNGMMNGGYNQGWQGGNQAMGWNMNGMGPQGHMQQKNGVFPNQQRTVFAEPFANEEENAYFRKPVNPHRHQNRNRRNRAPDYTQL